MYPKDITQDEIVQLEYPINLLPRPDPLKNLSSSPIPKPASPELKPIQPPKIEIPKFEESPKPLPQKMPERERRPVSEHQSFDRPPSQHEIPQIIHPGEIVKVIGDQFHGLICRAVLVSENEISATPLAIPIKGRSRHFQRVTDPKYRQIPLLSFNTFPIISIPPLITIKLKQFDIIMNQAGKEMFVIQIHQYNCDCMAMNGNFEAVQNHEINITYPPSPYSIDASGNQVGMNSRITLIGRTTQFLVRSIYNTFFLVSYRENEYYEQYTVLTHDQVLIAPLVPYPPIIPIQEPEIRRDDIINNVREQLPPPIPQENVPPTPRRKDIQIPFWCHEHVLVIIKATQETALIAQTKHDILLVQLIVNGNVQNKTNPYPFTDVDPQGPLEKKPCLYVYKGRVNEGIVAKVRQSGIIVTPVEKSKKNAQKPFEVPKDQCVRMYDWNEDEDD